MYAGNVPYTIAGVPVASLLSFYYVSKCDFTASDATRAVSPDMRHSACAVQ